MSFALNKTFQQFRLDRKAGTGLNLSSASDSIAYVQSRRAYYVTTLDLIPKVAKGTKGSPLYGYIKLPAVYHGDLSDRHH